MKSKNNKKAIISCGVLYREVNQLLSESSWDVEFLPQGLHDRPDSSIMKRQIQDKIDELEKKADYEQIVLGYGLCGGGVEGLSADGAELVVPKFHDCIPLLAGDRNLKGNMAEPGTYYLSRGWIDCSSDAYKEHLFFTDELERWRKGFREYKNAQKDSLTVDNVGWWFDRDRLDPEKRDREKFNREISRRVTLRCVGNYRSLALVDNDLLDGIHEEYAEEIHNFLRELLREEKGEDLEFKRLSADLEPLKKLLFQPDSSRAIHVQPPRCPLELESKV